MKKQILTESEKTKIAQAIANAEQLTLGEIVPVIVAASDPYPAARWRFAILFSLVGNFCLFVLFPHVDPLWILCAQFLTIGLGLMLGNWPPLKKLFLTDYNLANEVQQRAQQAFLEHNIHQTEAHTGVLIFISLFERRALVLADSGIHAKVGEEKWQAILEKLLRGIKMGKLADSLCETIRECGELLSQNFPAQHGHKNELVDQVFIDK